jgi:hypothetical protein
MVQVYIGFRYWFWVSAVTRSRAKGSILFECLSFGVKVLRL